MSWPGARDSVDNMRFIRASALLPSVLLVLDGIACATSALAFPFFLGCALSVRLAATTAAAFSATFSATLFATLPLGACDVWSLAKRDGNACK
jgi:hypothetical protein